MVSSRKKIIIAAGGTGGHVFPGVAIAEEIKLQHSDAEVIFAGTSRGLEAKVCKALGLALVLIESVSIKDRKGLGRLLAWGMLPLSVARGVYIMMKERPELIISIGGYAAGPLSAAAWLSRVPVVVLEPNSIAGFTNRILGKFAKKVFIAFEGAGKYFPRDKVIFSGNPVRREVVALKKERDAGKITIFVFGGSQGALTINRAIIGALPALSDFKGRFNVIHQTGGNDDIQAIRRAYEEAGIEANVFEFSNSIWEHYAAADLVVARAGAISIAELAVNRIPSILVPYPYAADDHQRANAKAVARAGGAVVVLDHELTGERLARELRIFLERPEFLSAMKAALEKIARPKAARVIVEEGLKVIGE